MNRLAALLLVLLLPLSALAQIGPVGAIKIGTTTVTGGTTNDCLTVDSNGKLSQTAACGAAAGLTIGTSTITGGSASGNLLTDAGTLAEANSTAISTSIVGPTRIDATTGVLTVGNSVQSIPFSGAGITHNMETVSVGTQVIGGTTAKPPIIWALFIGDGTNASGTATEPKITFKSRGSINAAGTITPGIVKAGEIGHMDQTIFDDGTGFNAANQVVNVFHRISNAAGASAPAAGVLPGMFEVDTRTNAGTMTQGLLIDHAQNVTFQNGLMTANKGIQINGTDSNSLLAFTTVAGGANFSAAFMGISNVGQVSVNLINSTSPGVSENISDLRYQGLNTSSATKTFASLFGLTGGTPTAGAENGRFQIRVAANGTQNVVGLEVSGGATGAGVTVPSTSSLSQQGTGTLNILTGLYMNNSILSDASRNLTANSAQTASPAGTTAGVWKLGNLVTAAVVLDTTRSIFVDIGGTVYKLMVAQ